MEETGADRLVRPWSPADPAFPVDELPGWEECLIPAGYRGGLAMAVHASDGRHVGFLGLLWADSEAPTPGVRQWLADVVPLLGHAVDPLRSLSAIAGLVQGAFAGVLLYEDGPVVALPGQAGHALLAADSALVAAARAELAAAQVHATFLWPLGGRQAPDGHAQVHVMRVRTAWQYASTRWCCWRPRPICGGLTPRELQILGRAVVAVMTTRNTRLVRLRLELAGIAFSGSSPQVRAGEVLQALAEVLEFDAAWLAVRDPEQRRHVPLATSGEAEPLRRYFERPDADVDVEQLGLNSRRPPMLTAEIPVPLPELAAWGDHLLPAGFRAGLAAGLFTTTGRHVGFLSILSQDASRPSTRERQVIASVTEVIADSLDRTREIAEMARLVEAAEAGVVLTRGGAGLPLPGLPGHPLLTAGSPVLALAASEIGRSESHVSFLVPLPERDVDPLIRVTVLDTARPGLDHLRAAVLLSPPGDLGGLTSLCLRALGLVAEGVTNADAVAAATGAPKASVAEALAVARDALGASTITALAAQALRSGLRIPPGCGTAGTTRPADA
jgi:hypothetical protein